MKPLTDQELREALTILGLEDDEELVTQLKYQDWWECEEARKRRRLAITVWALFAAIILLGVGWLVIVVWRLGGMG